MDIWMPIKLSSSNIEMSQSELDEIQLQLKEAIQNHQKLVSKIQLQPQDNGLKVQLHNLQKEIMSMSQKQKLAVQKLRKDLMERQPKDRDSNQNLENIGTNSEESVPKRSSVPVQSVPLLRVPQYHKSPGSQDSIEDQRRQKLESRTPEKKQSKHLDPSCEKARELKKKLDFMACIDLVPPDSIRDTPGKRSERKRKSTNNPNFAYGFELERRPKLTNFLASDYFGAKKTKSKPQPVKSENTSPTASRSTTPTSPDTKPRNHNHQNAKENMPENTICHVCHLGGQLIQCDSCRNVYHLHCLIPPLTIVPTGIWSCNKCQDSSQAQKSSTLNLSAVNTYISNKTGKEEDKRKLLKRSAELLQEKTHLENRSKQLNEILARQGVRKQELIEINLKAKQSVENLKNFVKAVQSS